jgi:hypothetical protein
MASFRPWDPNFFGLLVQAEKVLFLCLTAGFTRSGRFAQRDRALKQLFL